jgi:hypothetical protein
MYKRGAWPSQVHGACETELKKKEESPKHQPENRKHVKTANTHHTVLTKNKSKASSTSRSSCCCCRRCCCRFTHRDIGSATWGRRHEQGGVGNNGFDVVFHQQAIRF